MDSACGDAHADRMDGTTAAVIVVGALAAGLLSVKPARLAVRRHRDGALLLLILVIVLLALIEAAKLM